MLCVLTGTSKEVSKLRNIGAGSLHDTSCLVEQHAMSSVRYPDPVHKSAFLAANNIASRSIFVFWKEGHQNGVLSASPAQPRLASRGRSFFGLAALGL